MTKLPHLDRAYGEILTALGMVKTVTCQAHLSEALRAIHAAIRLEHDAHLREIRRLGT